MTVLELSPGSFLLLRVLILFCEFMQKLIPYVWNVVMDWVKGVQEIHYIALPSSDLWSMHEGKGEGDFFDRRVIPCDILVESEESFDFLNEIVYSEVISVERCWESSHSFDICWYCHWRLSSSTRLAWRRLQWTSRGS